MHAMQALRAGGDLFLLGNAIDDAQLAAAEQALAEFRPTDRVIERDKETLFMACEAEVFYLQPDHLSFCEPISCQYDMGADILEAESQGCDVLTVYVDSPEDAENFAENAHIDPPAGVHLLPSRGGAGDGPDGVQRPGLCGPSIRAVRFGTVYPGKGIRGCCGLALFSGIASMAMPLFYCSGS